MKDKLDKKMKTILVTCVGSGVGQSVIDSLNLKREYKIIGCDGNNNVFAHSYCDQFFTVPGLYSEGYTEFILNLCRENNVDVLIPGHDHELVLFANSYSKFQEYNIEVIVSKSDLISISRDKQKWFNFFSPLGCKIVPTISVSEFISNPDESILPAIVKPTGGSASQGISIINTLSELEGLKGDDIIQPYLFPEKSDPNYDKIRNAVKKGDFIQMSEISIQLIFNKKSKFSGIFISKNTLKNGVPIFVDPIDPQTFEYTHEILKFIPILENHNVKGPVNIQGRVTPDGLYFFEMNMRFTGITGNRALLGFNEVDFLVRDFLGLECELAGFAYNKVGVRQVACSTIPRQNNKKGNVITILGGGSNIGRKFIESSGHNFEQIYLIIRTGSKVKYQELFQKYDNINLVEEVDFNLSQVLCQSDLLINFVSALAYEEDLRKFEAIRFIQRMAILISKAKLSKIINISSQSVYPQALDLEKTESDTIDITTTYSFQKIVIEDMFNMIKDFSPLTEVVSLRLPRVIVPSLKGQSGFFGKVINDLRIGKEIIIEYPNNNTNLIHIDDVISAINYVVNNLGLKNFGQSINVSGENISMSDYVKLVKDAFNYSGTVKLGSSNEVTNSSMINGQKLKDLGWESSISVKQIIQELL